MAKATHARDGLTEEEREQTHALIDSIEERLDNIERLISEIREDVEAGEL